MNFSVVQDTDKAISVLHDVGQWMEDSGMNPSKWWKPENLNKEVLLKYAKPEEFYVGLVDGEPAAAEILQTSQDAQDWQEIDKGKSVKALYVHWLCVDRKFAGQGLPGKMIDFAKDFAREKGVNLIRVDTNADEKKLRKIYEDLGFKLVAEIKEDYRTTAFYQMPVV